MYMNNGERRSGGFEVVQDPAVIAHLTIGKSNIHGDKIGPGYQFRSPAEAARVAKAAGEATRPFTVPSAAFCIDERPITQLGDITNWKVLRTVVAPRLPGGTYLAATKAAAAAKAGVIRDAKDFNQAYDIVAATLNRMGYQDAAHEGCGAENNAVQSVHEQVDVATAFGTMRAAGVAAEQDQGIFTQLYANKQELVAHGYYDVFDPVAHKERVLRTAGHNFARLQEADDATHGHHASGLYLPEDERGLSNGFTEASGSMLFVYTHGFAKQLARDLGGSDEERHLIELAFGYDLMDVSNTLIAAPEGQSADADYYPGLAVLQNQYELVG